MVQSEKISLLKWALSLFEKYDATGLTLTSDLLI